MYKTAWKAARESAAEKWEEQREESPAEGFSKLRVHDLKHTFGQRLRAAGVSFEDRQDLLGHRSGRITTHYSQAELTNLIDAADKVCTTESRNHMAAKKKRLALSCYPLDCYNEYGAPGEIRTPDLLVRSQALYPTELRAQKNFYLIERGLNRVSANSLSSPSSPRKFKDKSDQINMAEREGFEPSMGF